MKPATNSKFKQTPICKGNQLKSNLEKKQQKKIAKYVERIFKKLKERQLKANRNPTGKSNHKIQQI